MRCDRKWVCKFTSIKIVALIELNIHRELMIKLKYYSSTLLQHHIITAALSNFSRLFFFQDNQVKMSPRVYQLILDLYEDSFGINYEKMWRSLVLGHTSSGQYTHSNLCH